MKIHVFFLLFWGVLFPSLFSQKLAITALEPKGDSVLVKYELSDANAERSYTIRLYAILNNDTLALTKVSGDVGDFIKPGSYEIIWDPISELERYRGNVYFYLTGIPSFFIDNPPVSTSVRKGNPISFSWFGGNSDRDTLTLELYQYDTQIQPVTVVWEVNQYTWKVPKEIAPGKGYRMKVSGTALTGIESYSNDFIIKRKVPLIALIAPAATILGGGVALLILARKPLPEPPDTPGG